MRCLATLFVFCGLLVGHPANAEVPEVGHEYPFGKRLACYTEGVMRVAFAGATKERDLRTRVAFLKSLGICFKEEPMTKGLVLARTPICVVEFNNFSVSAWELRVQFSPHYTITLLWLEPLEEI